MGFVRAFMRFFSLVFHGLLGLSLLGLSLLPLLGGAHNLRLDMLPWTGKALTYWLLGLSLFGLASVVLAIFGKLRPLLFTWSVAVLAMAVRGYYLSPYQFSPGEFWQVLGLTFGAFLAVVGAWFQLRHEPADYKSAY